MKSIDLSLRAAERSLAFLAMTPVLPQVCRHAVQVPAVVEINICNSAGAKIGGIFEPYVLKYNGVTPYDRA